MGSPVTFKEADMQRAIRVAAKEGLTVRACLVTRDGVRLEFDSGEPVPIPAPEAVTSPRLKEYGV